MVANKNDKKSGETENVDAQNRDNQIRIVRVYDAPVQMVWDAFTDSDQVQQWWGPRGFTITTHGKDLRPGGYWHYTMHGPDGTDYENKTIYFEVEPNQKLVYDHGGNDDREPLFRVTILFSEVNGKTTMDMTMALSSAEKAKAIRQHIKDANGNSTWDRLAEYLADKSEQKHSFVVNRSFPTTCEELFKAWSEPDLLAAWLPPVGFDMEVQEWNFQVGGRCFFKMTNNLDVTMHGQMDYLEITDQQQIVYDLRFCEADGSVSRHPLAPGFPERLRTTVSFSPDPEGARLTVVSVAMSSDADELKIFDDSRADMNQGWNGSFDKLESIVSNDRVSPTV